MRPCGVPLIAGDGAITAQDGAVFAEHLGRGREAMSPEPYFCNIPHGESWGKTKKGRWIAMRELVQARSFLFHGELVVEGKLDLASVHGLQWAPLSERALGLSPKQFWALVATKPERTLH